MKKKTLCDTFGELDIHIYTITIGDDITFTTLLLLFLNQDLIIKSLTLLTVGGLTDVAAEEKRPAQVGASVWRGNQGDR